jgi:hypothetical protein
MAVLRDPSGFFAFFHFPSVVSLQDVLQWRKNVKTRVYAASVGRLIRACTVFLLYGNQKSSKNRGNTAAKGLLKKPASTSPFPCF